MFGRTSQSHVPESHTPPVSAHGLSLSFLLWLKLATLRFPHLYESLQAHSRPVLFEVLNVAKGLCVGNKLHHVATQIRRRRQNELRDKGRALVLKELLLVLRIVHVVHVDRYIHIERLQ